MRLGGWLAEVGERRGPETLEHLRSLVGIEWVRQALERTGTMSLRRRKLPSEAVVWLVIGISLFRGRSIDAVVKQLGLLGPEAEGRRSATGSPVSSAAVTKARQRVGPEPVVELYGLTSERWVAECDEHNRWHGLRLFALDGSTLRIADTPANEEVYGRPGSSRRGKAGYPQARLVGLLTLGSRLLADLVIGTWEQGEVNLGRMLLGNVPRDSLLILDRGFVDHGLFADFLGGEDGRHFLCRAKKGSTPRVVKRLGKDDELVEIKISPTQRRERADLPETIVVRRIGYRVKGFRPGHLLTSLVDPEAYPAPEIVELYHQRWEIEIAYDEIKTHTLEREEALRSQTPDGVLQEIYGLAIAYNVVRVMMARAAVEAGVSPGRMSFRNSLLEIQVFLLGAWYQAPGRIPREYKRLSEQLSLLVLPKRRSRRRYARAVKIKMTGYRRKKVH